jgi:hypothetical protein
MLVALLAFVPTLFTEEPDGLLPPLAGPPGAVADAQSVRERFRHSLESLSAAVARVAHYTPPERVEDSYRLVDEIDAARALLTQCRDANWWAYVCARHAHGNAALYLMARARGARMIQWLLDQDEIPPLPAPAESRASVAARLPSAAARETTLQEESAECR